MATGRTSSRWSAIAPVREVTISWRIADLRARSIESDQTIHLLSLMQARPCRRASTGLQRVGAAVDVGRDSRRRENNLREPGTAIHRVKLNNFDVIRLVAALQVLYVHGVSSLNVAHPVWLLNTVKLFPGVPIFYFVSGMLISMSWENNSRVREYARNRILRIYPALIVCTALAVSSVFAAGYLWNDQATVPKFGAWVLGQITIAQFFTPQFMRGYGVGALNGSLGTLTVELQFYILVPLLYFLLRMASRARRHTNLALLALILVFLGANTEFNHRGGQFNPANSMKLLDVSFIPWLYMFLLGVLVQRNFDRVLGFVHGRAVAFGTAYVVCASFARSRLHWQVSNAIHPLLFVLLAMFVLSCAYTSPTLASRLLRRNDISYGVYIFHMPVFNLLVYKGGLGKNSSLAIGTLVAVTLGALSWMLLERPILRFKRNSLRPGEEELTTSSTTDPIAATSPQQLTPAPHISRLD